MLFHKMDSGAHIRARRTNVGGPDVCGATVRPKVLTAQKNDWSAVRAVPVVYFFNGGLRSYNLALPLLESKEKA
jgi:hypothetical protein